ncbi:hypothetical protein AVP_13 [Aerococcus phage vB_AviM_AVP]|nr:hypothetical protein AVP_13 [Aerococcus phage vB_AviM_AVP]
MLELSAKIVNEEIEALEYSGFESDTILDTRSEFHQEAYNLVKYNSVERLKDVLLDKASEQLDETEEGNFLWKLVYSSINAKAEIEVHHAMLNYIYDRIS